MKPLVCAAIVLICGVTRLSAGTIEKQDFAGCTEFKQLPAGTGCMISECGAKRSDTLKIQLDAGHQENVEGPSAFIRYSCNAPVTVDSLLEHLSGVITAAGFKVIYKDPDPVEGIITAKKLGVSLDVDASPLDTGGAIYTLTAVEAGPSKPLTGEICSEAGLFTLPKACSLTDCNSKRKDKAEMRTTASAQAILDGPVRTSGFACDTSITSNEVFDAAQAALKAAGFEIVFVETTKPEYSWLTARSGKRWVELMSTQESDGIAYQLTDVVSETVGKK